MLKDRFEHLAARWYLRRKRVDAVTLPGFEGAWPMFVVQGILRLGKGCFFRSARFRTILTVFENATLEIGDHGFVNDGVNICAAERIDIGPFCKIADLVTIYDTNFHQLVPAEPVRKCPVRIGKNVWLGLGTIILPGAVIGDHSVIGAGSVVSGHIAAKSVAVGAPARVVKTFECGDDWVRG